MTILNTRNLLRSFTSMYLIGPDQTRYYIVLVYRRKVLNYRCGSKYVDGDTGATFQMGALVKDI